MKANQLFEERKKKRKSAVIWFAPCCRLDMGTDRDGKDMARRESHQVWRTKSREGSEVISADCPEVSGSGYW